MPLVSLNNINAAALRGLHHVIWAQLMEPDIRYLIITVSILIIGQFITVNKVETEYAMGINVVGAVLALLIAARILRSKLPQKIYSITPKYETRIWLMSSVPLVLAGGAQLINSQTDLIMLGVFSVSEEVGIYKVSVSLASLAIFFMMVTNTITSPYLAKMHVQGNHASLQKVMKISVTISTILSLPIIIILLLMGSDIIKVVFGAEFSPGSTALSILCIGQFICVSMGSAGVLLNMSGKEKIVMNILLFSALLNVILNAILIPLYGINGAAIGTAISTSIWHILQSLMVYKSLGIISNIFAIIKNQLQPEL